MPDSPYIVPADLRTMFPADLGGSRFETDFLAGLVAEFEDKLEGDKGYAMTRRTVTGERHRLRRRVRSVTLFHPGVLASSVTATLDGEDLDLDPDLVTESSGRIDMVVGPGLLLFDYQHGPAQTRPDARRACGLFVRREAMAFKTPSTSNAYVTSNTELGITTRDSVADPAAGRLTGWIDVDRICRGIRPRPQAGLD